MTIMLGTPILRNRAWILPQYLEHLYNLDFPKSEIHLAFLLNGKEIDNTAEIIWDFVKKYQDEYWRIDIWERSDNGVDNRSYRDYNHFAELRNEWLSMRRKKDTHVFSVDSDILMPPNTLTKLTSHGKGVISALICNGYINDQNVFYNILNKHNNGTYCHILPEKPLMEVDVTGACCVIRRDLLDKGIQYSHHIQGEDCGFCEDIQQKGYKIYCDTTIQPEHIMSEDQL